MLSSFASVAAMSGLLGLAQSTCTELSGNWYCNQVSAVTYDNFGGSGSYNRVSSMSDTTGACSFTTQSYSGVNAPFDEELSLHLRGPIQLKQFAFYTPTTPSKSKREEHVHKHQHQHSNVHARRDPAPAPATTENEEPTHVFEERSSTSAAGTTGSTVSCPSSNSTTYTYGGHSYVIECGFDRAGNINFLYTANFATCIQACSNYAGCVDVSYQNGGGACYMKGTVQSPSYNSGVWGARLVSAAASSSTIKISSTPSTSTSSLRSTSILSSSTLKSSSAISTTATTLATSTLKTPSSSSSSSVIPTATGSTWTRQSYYSSTSGTATNVTFLNTMGGGSVSGVWSTYFGNSLSYASSSGTAAASSPQTLADTTITGEVILFSGQACSGENGDCGYYRPGTVAYHGFGGAAKIFMLEFAMPTGASGSDMPAIWLLNALIPRTQQYGSCTCWGNTNGCGELDIFEVLTSGLGYMTSSIHGNQAGGDSDYFARPTGSTIKAAIVLNQGVLSIRVLPSAFTFDAQLTATGLATLMDVVGTNSVVTLA